MNYNSTAKEINPLDNLCGKIVDDMMSYAPEEQNTMLRSIKLALIERRKEILEKAEYNAKGLATSLEELSKI